MATLWLTGLLGFSLGKHPNADNLIISAAVERRCGRGRSASQDQAAEFVPVLADIGGETVVDLSSDVP